MKTKLPVELGICPIYEVVWDIKFKPPSQPVADIFPGIMWAMKYHDYEISKLPISSLPDEAFNRDPNLIYAAKIRMDKDNHTLQFGNRIITFNCRTPYPGWSKLKDEIVEFIKALNKPNIKLDLESVSMQYLNSLETSAGFSVNNLDLDIHVAKREMKDNPILLKMFFEEKGLSNLIDVMTHAQTHIISTGEILHGINIVVSVTKNIQGKTLSDLPEYLDEVHSQCKELFFDLLKEETVKLFAPCYE